MNKVAFFDRDGTINVDHGYTYRTKDFQFVEGVLAFMTYLSQQNFKFVVVTNQAGVAKGYFTLEESLRFSDRVVVELEKNRITVEQVLTCPHHPEGVVEEYAISCCCRKPQPGLIVEYLKGGDWCLRDSLIVGNKLSDILAGLNAGLGKGLLIGPDEAASKIYKFEDTICAETKGFKFYWFREFNEAVGI